MVVVRVFELFCRFEVYPRQKLGGGGGGTGVKPLPVSPSKSRLSCPAVCHIC